MSNLSEKYRPRRFADLWQGLDDPTVKIVTRELAQGTPSSPMLLRSPYGGGKTSTARIAGMRTACMDPGAHPYEPCLECKACHSILADVVARPFVINEYGYSEIDCTRLPCDQIIQLVTEELRVSKIWSQQRAFEEKVVIFDEFGRLTDTQQRKFLKLLETRRGMFILCCADEDNLDDAIRKRCSIRCLQLPSVDRCTQQILRIAQAENAVPNSDAARLLAQRCGSVPRDILLTLSDALVLGDGRLTISSVQQALDLRHQK